ncbi:hypothetical protein C5167_019772 [Papaver somniferum]|uniref:Allene oxide synthase n=1 Tax=Papaver somniferum TaxID=3469 RepID=A0A4Y7IT83_PAPSO|nr:hypothetical protein C5167_019772 [Papaver somniferum]
MPPGPFISSNSKVVILLDSKSFSILFDVSKVEKKDLFTGTYMPSTKLTGGYRVLSYLDPSEPNHSKLKQLFLSLMHSQSEYIIPDFRTSFGELFDTLESKLASKCKVNFDAPTGGLNEKACFNFLARSWLSTNPTNTEFGDGAPSKILPWFLFIVAPIAPVSLPCFLEDPLLHTFRLPPCLLKRGYQELYNFFYTNACGILDQGEKMGIKRDEVCHNLLLFVRFNAFTGMKAHFPNIKKKDQSLRFKDTKASVIYEVLRLDPATPFQYAKAKTDLVIEKHESAFQVKQGEMLFGYMPIVTKDPKVFERAEEFVADRFVGVEGEKLLKYVV